MNLAARVQAAASPGELLITAEMLESLGAENALSAHGLTMGPERTVTLKNIGARAVYPVQKILIRLGSVHSEYIPYTFIVCLIG